MSYFLWVEDFENEARVTASNVFGGVLDGGLFDDNRQALKRNLKNHGVFIELNFQDGLSFICSELDSIDYVILDIDLPAYGDDGINQDVLDLLVNYEGYQIQEDESEDEQLRIKACSELKKIAGFYLYTKLVVELGFPKDHILFCSNHGENTKTIQKAFKTARMGMPKIYQKSDDVVQQWVKQRYDNPYSRLRRGIIEACNFLKDKKLRFNDYSADNEKSAELDVENYLEILKLFMRLREPANVQSTYKLFVRTLAHEWDEAVKPKKLEKQQVTLAFSWIMKMTRNWSAHTHVFDRLKAQDVAFLFIVNMRAMFDLGENLVLYEKHLLSLFETPLDVDKFKSIVGANYKDRQIPLTQEYARLINQYGKTYEAMAFHDLLNEYQKKKSGKEDFLVQGLYQVFWFLTSYGRVHINQSKIQDQKYLNYQFVYFNYAAGGYLLEIGRHIYNTSFPQT